MRQVSPCIYYALCVMPFQLGLSVPRAQRASHKLAGIHRMHLWEGILWCPAICRFLFHGMPKNNTRYAFCKASSTGPCTPLLFTWCTLRLLGLASLCCSVSCNTWEYSTFVLPFVAQDALEGGE